LPVRSRHATARQAIAYHEAGHTVVAAAMGYDVYQINTYAPGAGAVWFHHRPDEQRTAEGRRRLLSVDVAGRLAQSVALDENRDVVTSFVESVASIRDMFGSNVDEGRALACGLEGDDVDVALHLQGRPDEEVHASLLAARAHAREGPDRRVA
jgi:hypothetical protein